MTAKLTKQEFVNWLKQSEGKQYDMDGWYGFQCFDYANAGWQQLYGYNLSGAGAKDIPFVNNFTGKATVIQNTPEFIAEPGDMVVFNNKYGGGYGHVAWVVNADINNITVIEQNWLGGGWTSGPSQGGTGWEKATKRTHSYDFPMWFIRPNFKQADVTVKSSQSATVGNKKPTVNQKVKPVKLQIIKDVVQGYKLPTRGYKPKGIVIHNDAGSKHATAESYRNGLVKAPLSRLEAGIAHSYVSGNTVWQALDESQVGWHTANQTGNKDYYGIEVCQSMGADNATFLKNEQATFQECARLLKKWGLPANRNTIRLHHEFKNTECPHRSFLLHAGINTREDKITDNAILKVKDYFIKQIRAFMNGDIPVATVSNKSSASSNTVKPIASAWKRNSYGTYYMAEKARFINGNQPIAVRLQGPFTTCPIGYQFQPRGYCNYDEVMLQDGHVWIGYDWQGQRYYLPIRTWNGAAPPNHSVGDLWGSIK